MGFKVKLKQLLTRHPRLNALYGAVFLGGKSVFGRCPASRGPDELNPAPFFIIGAARSGNTLLRALLVGHSAIAIPPESYVLGSIARKWDRLNFLDWEDLVKTVIGEFESHPEFHTWQTELWPVYEQLLQLDKEQRSLAIILDTIYRHYATTQSPGATVWGDKTPLNTERIFLIDRVFPGARYIHMLRDGRDAVSSAVKAKMFGGSVEAACEQWLMRVRNARELGDKIGSPRYMELRYEDLAFDPQSAVQWICTFLGVEFEKQMMDNSETFKKMGDTTALDHHAAVGLPVNTGSIGKWKERLTPRQIELMKPLLRDELKSTGYNTDDHE